MTPEPDPAASAAYASALRSLAAREMSERELGLRLRRKGHDAEIVVTVVERLRVEGWVDDLRFACSFLRQAARSRPAAPRRLRAELERRGCSRTVVQEAFVRVSREFSLDEVALARSAASRRRGVEARRPDRLVRHLAGRGFSHDVVRRILAEREDDAPTAPSGGGEDDDAGTHDFAPGGTGEGDEGLDGRGVRWPDLRGAGTTGAGADGPDLAGSGGRPR